MPFVVPCSKLEDQSDNQSLTLVDVYSKVMSNSNAIPSTTSGQTPSSTSSGLTSISGQKKPPTVTPSTSGQKKPPNVTPSTSGQKKPPDACQKCNKKITKTSQFLKCYNCSKSCHITCYAIPESIYNYLKDNVSPNVQFICTPCRKEDLKVSQNSLEEQVGKLTLQIQDISKQMKKITETHQNFEKTSLTITNAAESITNRQPTWAELAAKDTGEENEMITTLANKVVNTQIKLTQDREEREKNMIIFNAKENEKNDINLDIAAFGVLCQQGLGLQVIPDVKMQRLGSKEPNKTRPIKVSFSTTWEKRRYFAKLYKLKTSRYQDIRISHDMNEEDRQMNKNLLKKAHELNESEKPSDFKYKVRGPPWSQKIVKVFQKN